MTKLAARRPGRPIDPGLRDRRRSQILAAACKCFARLGFYNTDVQLIADSIGVGKGTIYRYFPTKEALFLAVAEDTMKRLEQYISDAVAELEHPLEIIRRAADSYAEFFEKHPETIEIMVQERAAFRGSVPETRLVYREKNRGRFEQVLRRGIELGLFRPVDLHKTTDAFANLLYGTVMSSHAGPRTKGQLVQAVRHGVELLLKGIVREGENK